MAVEVAQKRARKYDVGLMERAMRQVSTRQETLQRAKARCVLFAKRIIGDCGFLHKLCRCYGRIVTHKLPIATCIVLR